MEEEIFLDTSLHGFKMAEEAVKARGYVEKRYTSSTKKEIEGAYKRQLLKQIITPAMGPANINALKPQINQMIQTTLYESGPAGAKVFKFKMYVPGKELRAQIDAAAAAGMQGNENGEEEAFAPDNYGKYASKVDKAEKAVLEAYSNVKNISPNSASNNIQRALDKSQSAHKMATELLPKLMTFGNVQLTARGQSAFAKAQQLLAHSQAIKGKWGEPYNELANLMATKMKLNKPLKAPTINEEFIENIMNFDNNNKNNNNNDKNNNKFMGKAMSLGMMPSDIKFIRDIMKIFTSRGMSKNEAIELGVILGNLPKEELQMLVNQIKPVIGKSNDEIAQQLYSYLKSKKSGGRRTRRQTRRVIKKRATRRRY